jgi:hypothetical protein
MGASIAFPGDPQRGGRRETKSLAVGRYILGFRKVRLHRSQFYMVIAVTVVRYQHDPYSFLEGEK